MLAADGPSHPSPGPGGLRQRRLRRGWGRRRRRRRLRRRLGRQRRRRSGRRDRRVRRSSCSWCFTWRFTRRATAARCASATGACARRPRRPPRTTPTSRPTSVERHAAALFGRPSWPGTRATARRSRSSSARDLLVEWNRRLDDFDRKGWHNRVEVIAEPEVQYVGLDEPRGRRRGPRRVRIRRTCAPTSRTATAGASCARARRAMS